MRLFGLIGYPLSHSFSKKYFSEKFRSESIPDATYDLYELADINDFPALLLQHPGLRGLNVTIPHKLNIIPFLDYLDDAAARIGAVNVIKIYPDGRRAGYNSDYFGFRNSLLEWFKQLHGMQGLQQLQSLRALILGSGGASKAVQTALYDLAIPYQVVSRQGMGSITYERITEPLLSTHRLIINTTPLGMSPQIETYPSLPYQWLTDNHYLYDLVYNPTHTAFMQKGQLQKARVLNGLPMLYAQAEKSWEIWNA